MRDPQGWAATARGAHRALRAPGFAGLLLGLGFWWQSLTPTLVPRSWVTQAVVTGVCAAIGYGCGCLMAWAGRRILVRQGWSVAPRRWGWIALGAGWLGVVVVGSVLWLGWQNSQRDVMGLAPLHGWSVVPMVAMAVAVWALLLGAARAVSAGAGALHARRRRLMPGAGGAVAAALAVALVVLLAGGVAWRGVTALANSFYGSMNEETAEGVVVPTSSSVSGSSESLVAWETLGRTGRDFVAGVSSTDELATFHGGDAAVLDPVRVYVGARSADSLEAQAELAVRELERAGGFDREVLVVWVPTGSGWMIEEAAEALEQLYAGDTAIVGIQYSYLPSLLSVFLDPGLAIQAGSVLFNAVEERWAQLPPDERPQLLMFGKSLGTAGVEAIFASVDATSSVGNLVARTDGALIVGAKYVNPIHSQVTRERDPGSPVWQPVFAGGRTVQFLNRDPTRQNPGLAGPAPRILYLQHPSDPVPSWGVESLWRPPEWMDEPRGYDVPDAASWFPVVTAVQAVGDQIFQLSPPPGFGHDYSTDYAAGWARLLPPEGWTQTDTERLERYLADRTTGEEEP